MAVQHLRERRPCQRAGKIHLRIQPKFGRQGAQRGILRPTADHGQGRCQVSFPQQPECAQENIRPLVGNEPPEEHQRTITHAAGEQHECLRIVGIANLHGFRADVPHHRFADGNVRGRSRQPSLQARVPCNTPIRGRQPCLVRNHQRLAQQERGPDRLEADVVLKKNITPSRVPDQLARRRAANNLKRPGATVVRSRLSKHADRMARTNEFTGKQSGNRLNASDVWRKAV